MKNKGFTLVELLAVVTLLGIIALIAIPVVTNAMSKQKEKLYYDQLNQLIKAAQNWGTDNVDALRELPANCGESFNSDITLKTLIDGNEDVSYLNKDFINPKTKENFSNETYVKVYKQGKNYLYCVESPDCANNKFSEYSSIASNICCKGSEFSNRLSACKLNK